MKRLFQILLIATLTTGMWSCTAKDGNEPVSANSDQQAAPAANPAPEETFAPAPAPAPPSRRSTTGASREATASRSPEAPARNDERPDSRDQIAENRSPATPPAATPAPAARATMTVPSGTTLTVALIDSLSTETSEVDDRFSGSLAEPLTIDGKVVAEKGTRVEGRVERVDEPGKVKGKAALELVLTGIRDGSRTIDLSTEPFTAVAEDNKDRDAGIIAGGAGVGAVIGAIAGGKKGAAIGAVIGGGSGTTAVLVTRGEHIRLDSETRVNFVLDDSVRLPVIR